MFIHLNFVIDLLKGIKDPTVVAKGLVINCASGTQGNKEDKFAALAELRPTNDVTIEHFDYLLGNMEPQSYAFWVYLLGRFKETKQLEKLRLVLFFYANTSVNNLDLKECFLAWLVDDRN